MAHKPYFRLIEPGLHVGYRKLASGPGTWIVRRYSGSGGYAVENLRTREGGLVVADDYSDADGASVLTFAQAQERAKAKRPNAPERTGPYTVADALDDYLRFLESDGRSSDTVKDARTQIDGLIRPGLGTVKVASLTADRLRYWRDELVKAAPRLRTKKGREQQYRDAPATDDARRARRSTTNRTWTILRAALNHAFNEGKANSDLAWRKVKPFRKVNRARVRYLIRG